ncbi:MAG TPA: MFS transporter [Micromonosporaceae bacterium]
MIQFMIVLDGSILVVALPSIQRELGFSPAGLAWVMDSYMLALGGFLLLGGRAADLIGRRRLVFWGLGLFILASLASAMATAPWQLVAARVVQGLGAALASPAALALVTDTFPEGPSRNKAMAIWGGMGGTAGGVGILLGGLLTAVAWEWTFLINVPIGVIVMLLAVRMLPPSRPHAHGGMDVFGALAATGGLCVFVYAVVRGSVQGWDSALTWAEFGLAAVLLGGFAIRQRTAVAPLIPRVLFRLPNVVLGNAANALVGALLFSGFVMSAIYLQQVRGLGPVLTSLTILPLNLGMFIGSHITIRVMDRFPPTTVLTGGLLVQAGALAWWASVLGPKAHLLTSFMIPGLVWCAGLGASIVAGYVVCTAGSTGAEAGAASGLVTMTLQIGGAVGIATLSTVAEGRASSVLAEASGAVSLTAALSEGHSYAVWTAFLFAVTGALFGLRLGQRLKDPAGRAV